jgi:hypothetical protein
MVRAAAQAAMIIPYAFIGDGSVQKRRASV